MQFDNNTLAFFALVRAGLWEKDAQLSRYKSIEYPAVIKLAEEQSVTGVITAGLEKVSDVKLPKELLLQLVGNTLQIEQQNKAMNDFVAGLIEKLRKNDVYALLVKGQGIAQCYERPLWRSCGDVDLLLSNENYEKAKLLLLPLAQSVEPEFETQRHLGITIEGYTVELHGTLHSRLSCQVDDIVDLVRDECFYNGEVRSWLNGKTQIFLPSINQDVIFVFTHLLHHFFIEGVGLRQICDWCRLLWTYRETLDVKKLERHLIEMRLMSEWKTFASLSVEWLGMPIDAMPFYSDAKKWSLKAKKVMAFVLKTGNFGHNRDVIYSNSFIVRKLSSLWLHTKDSARLFFIFPLDTIKCWFQLLVTGTIETVKGNG